MNPLPLAGGGRGRVFTIRSRTSEPRSEDRGLNVLDLAAMHDFTRMVRVEPRCPQRGSVHTNNAAVSAFSVVNLSAR